MNEAVEKACGIECLEARDYQWKPCKGETRGRERIKPGAACLAKVMSLEEHAEKCISRASIAVENLDLCRRAPTSTKRIRFRSHRKMPPPLLTDQGLSPDLSRGPRVAGQDASEPPAVSPTARIEEMILR